MSRVEPRDPGRSPGHIDVRGRVVVARRDAAEGAGAVAAVAAVGRVRVLVRLEVVGRARGGGGVGGGVPRGGGVWGRRGGGGGGPVPNPGKRAGGGGGGGRGGGEGGAAVAEKIKPGFWPRRNPPHPRRRTPRRS